MNVRTALVLASSLAIPTSCRSPAPSEPPPPVGARKAVDAPATTDLEELRAFARLYGYARYFHPSDEAAAVDWDRFVVHGVGRVMRGTDRAELDAALEELFLPIAPTLDVFVDGESPRTAADLFPASTEGLELVAWQHLGYGFGDMPTVYSSKRTHRRRDVPAGQQRTVLAVQDVEASALRGKTIRLRGWARTDPEAPQASTKLHMRIHQPSEQSVWAKSGDHEGFEWGEVSVQQEVPDDATTITLGAAVTGQGAVWVDEFSLDVRDGASWRPVPLVNPGFEDGTEATGWELDAPNFTQQIRPQARGGNRSLWLARKTITLTEAPFEEQPEPGELLRASLGAGLWCQLPISLYSKGGHTLPPPGWSAVEPVLPSAVPRSANDPAVRIAAVIVTWNVFQHFYPYFDAVDVDWSAVLDKALAAVLLDGSAADTVQTLEHMVSALHDGHGWVQPPFAREAAPVPVSFARVEGRVVVLAAAEADLLRRGDVVRRYEGRDIDEVVAAASTRASGSPQWVEHRLLAWSGFSEGPPGSMASFEIERSGETMTVEVQRRNAHAPTSFEHEPIEELERGVWYVDLSRAVWADIQPELATLAAASGVIFDLRAYPKGDNFLVLQHLLTAPENDRWMLVPRIIRPDHVAPAGWTEHGWDLTPAEPRITGKVAFITGAGAISYAESVMGYVEGFGLGEIIGGPTAGANGNVNPFTTPGGYVVISTGMRVVKHDGSTHHVVGVTPTIPMEPTLEGLRAGRDELLERAMEVVRPPRRTPGPRARKPR
ncbi:S41 family peptidase [Paraliomyxa miuraensis]|uniref:S41 family peptidase n=1 Tax=Paraliomyxa miuraensis TaxID=376150 RepID=UPI0022560AB9|nr:S41 family peptidase [Paraliomyxa miuraensis]MCX4241675.1 S41 family peptidase [Paraliomyxa miuraensis]